MKTSIILFFAILIFNWVGFPTKEKDKKPVPESLSKISDDQEKAIYQTTVLLQDAEYQVARDQQDATFIRIKAERILETQKYKPEKFRPDLYQR